MQSFVIAINSVLPIFLMLALGFFLKQIKLIDNEMITKVNKLVFKVFLPNRIIKVSDKSDLSDHSDNKKYSFLF